MTSQSTTHTSSTSADRAGVGKDHDRRRRSDADPPGGNPLLVGTVEDLGLAHGTVRDDFSLCIRRDAGSRGGTVSEHEGRWVGRLRRISTAKLRHWGIPGLVADAESVISELAANALVHGKGDRVGFRFLLTADVLVIEVDDGSPGRARVNEADPYDESGRGLFIVSALSTRCGVSPDGTRTWCTLAIPATALSHVQQEEFRRGETDARRDA